MCATSLDIILSSCAYVLIPACTVATAQCSTGQHKQCEQPLGVWSFKISTAQSAIEPMGPLPYSIVHH